MIDITTAPDIAGLIAALEREASARGEARAEAAALARSAPAERWRRAHLLWPNFTKG